MSFLQVRLAIHAAEHAFQIRSTLLRCGSKMSGEAETIVLNAGFEQVTDPRLIAKATEVLPR